MPRFITTKQLDNLKGFYTHCWCVYHEKAKACFEFWAEVLDNEAIPWSIQNSVAIIAEDRESIGKYLTTLLAEKDILVAQ